MNNGGGEPKWIPEDTVADIHDAQIERHGGSSGLRAPDGLASALARAQNRFFYAGETSLFRLAAAYAEGVIRNHPYVDGNKRTGYALAETFLNLNGLAVAADDDDIFPAVLALATREMSEDDFAQWLESRSHPPRSN